MLSVVVCSCITSQRTPIATRVDNPTATVIATASAPRLNINTASALQLEVLPGVGKVLAERIVAYREQNGPFRRAEHLMMVRGFSDNKFRAIRELVTIE